MIQIQAKEERLTLGTAFQISKKEMGGNTLATSRPMTLNSLHSTANLSGTLI